MVQPANVAPLGYRSEAPRAGSGAAQPKYRNDKEFSAVLARDSSAVSGGVDRGPVEPSWTTEIAKELPPGTPWEGTWASLAAEEEPSAGRTLDPAEWLAQFTVGGGEAAFAPALPAPAPAAARVEPPLTELVERWVRRVALGGDARRGVAKLDIGHGSYAGAQLVVAAEAGRVTVELVLPAGSSDVDLAARLEQRLTARGYQASVAVR